jgi:hypothetical protein
MSNKDEKTIENLLAAGIIGAALGALLLKNKAQGATLGALAGAAILASSRAYENAHKTNVPVMVEEDNVLYNVYPDGTKKKVKKLPKPDSILRKNFTI